MSPTTAELRAASFGRGIPVERRSLPGWADAPETPTTNPEEPK